MRQAILWGRVLKMKSLRALTVVSTMAMAFSACADEMYAGLGLPGFYTVGYSRALGKSWGVRAQYSGGMDFSSDPQDVEGVTATVRIKSSTAGVYADFFPFESSGFRLVGGIASNDTKVEMNAVGTGSASIGNADNVAMAGETYNVSVKFPGTAPYLGLGYGHHKGGKGFGFYADFGFLIGKPKVTSQTSLVSSRKVSQADVDAQDAKFSDSVSKIGAMPVLHLGMLYRF